MPKNFPIPFKITSLTPQTIFFQSSYPWAFLLGAHYESTSRLYSLPNNFLSQSKLKKLLPDYDFPSLSNLSLPPLPSLRPYQQVDLGFLLPLKKIGIFSEMRTGKSPLALRLFQKWPISKLLLIVPAILQSQWQKATEEWIQKPSLIITHLEKKWRNYFYQKLTTGDESFILIISKDTFKLDKVYWEKVQKRKNLPSLAVIIDEAHFLRNYQSQQSKSLYTLRNIPYKMVLTGTPTVNHQSDIFGILKFLEPQKYTSYWKFVEEYFKVKKFKVTYRQKGKGRVRFFFRWEVGNFKSLAKKQELQQLVNSFSVNRRQKEVLPWLPKIMYQTESLLMEEEQRETYQKLVSRWKEHPPLDILAQLKTLTLYPPVLSLTKPGAKVNYLINYCLEQIDKNSSLLIFSTRSETFLIPLAEILTKKKIKVGLITGSTPFLKKEMIIKEFQSGKLNILLANLQCVGLGLNLSRANTVIFADRSYSPADNEQAEARFLPTTRQENQSVKLVIDLVCQGTIDEQILGLLKKKENLIKVLNDNPKSFFEQFKRV